MNYLSVMREWPYGYDQCGEPAGDLAARRGVALAARISA